MLVELNNRASLANHLTGAFLFYGGVHTPFEPELAQMLRNARWIFDNSSKTFKSPRNISVSDMPSDYDTTYRASGVIRFLKIKTDPALIQFSQQATNLIQNTRENGLTRTQVIDELKKIINTIF